MLADLPDALVCPPEAAAVHPEADLVVIAAPNDRHAALAEAALRAGKHVVVDKPFTVTLAEARHLARVARETGRLLSVFQNRRWDSDFLALRAALASGAIGEAMHVEAHFDRYRPRCAPAGAGRPGRAPASGSIWGRTWSIRHWCCWACRSW